MLQQLSVFFKIMRKYCPGEADTGYNAADYVNFILKKFMSDHVQDLCPVLDCSPKHLTEIYSGRKPLSARNAYTVLQYRRKAKLAKHIDSRCTQLQLKKLEDELNRAGFVRRENDATVGAYCASVLEAILEETVAEANKRAGQAYEGHPVYARTGPAAVTSPAGTLSAPEEEFPVLLRQCILKAYASGKGLRVFTAEMLERKEHEDLKPDYLQRQAEYAHMLRWLTTLKEMHGSEAQSRFNALLEEVYAGIYNTWRRNYPDGYQRMCAVMEQCVLLHLAIPDRYGRETVIPLEARCGLVHYLVKEGRISWVI